MKTMNDGDFLPTVEQPLAELLRAFAERRLSRADLLEQTGLWYGDVLLGLKTLGLRRPVNDIAVYGDLWTAIDFPKGPHYRHKEHKNSSRTVLKYPKRPPILKNLTERECQMNRTDQDIQEIMTQLGRAVRARRKALGMTQDNVALLANTGLRFVSDLEAGKVTVQMGKGLAVLRVLGMTSFFDLDVSFK